MKALLNLLILLFISISLYNCSGDEDTLNITSITIEVDQSTILLTQTATLKAINQDNIDITNEVDFYLNNDKMDGNVFVPKEIGNVAIRAKYELIASSYEVVTVIENISSITLSSDKSTIKPVSTDKAIFTALNQDGKDVTSVVDIFKDGVDHKSKYFNSNALGVNVFIAKYNGVESNSLQITSELNVSSLTLSADRNSFPANNTTSPIFYIIDQDGDTISSFSKVFHNGSELANRAFQTSQIDTYDFIAKYESIESSVLTLSAEAQRSNRKILIEEFTGEWCGWCPQAAFNLDELVSNNSKVLTVGIHNGDGIAYENEGIIRNQFGLNYFPSGLVGRVNLGQNVGYNGTTLDSDVTDEVDRQLNNEEVLAGIAINTSIVGSNLLVDVDVEFYNNISEKIGYTIYLIENDVVSGSQQNYFANNSSYQSAYYYSQPSVIPSYEHQYVLRKVATDVYGEDISNSESVTDNTYSIDQKSIDISSYDASKCFVIAFVHYDLRGNNKSIINAQQVKAGENTSFIE